jgi:hypothetical protein
MLSGCAELRVRVQRRLSGEARGLLGRAEAALALARVRDEPTFHAPVFVVTHRPAETIVKRGRHVLHLRHRRDRARPGPRPGGRRIQ